MPGDDDDDDDDGWMDVWMRALSLRLILSRVRIWHSRCETAPYSNNRHATGPGGIME